MQLLRSRNLASPLQPAQAPRPAAGVAAAGGGAVSSGASSSDDDVEGKRRPRQPGPRAPRAFASAGRVGLLCSLGVTFLLLLLGLQRHLSGRVEGMGELLRLGPSCHMCKYHVRPRGCGWGWVGGGIQGGRCPLGRGSREEQAVI